MGTNSRSEALRSLLLIGVGAGMTCLLALPTLAAERAAKTKSAPAAKAAADAPVADSPGKDSAATEDAAESVMSVWETRVHAALRRESSAKGAAQEQATRDLVALYESLEKAKGIDKDERAELRGLVRNRLMRISQRISKRLDKAGKKPAAVAAASEVLPAADTASTAGSGKTADSQTAAGGQGGQQGLADYGLELVDLIQHTIAPQSWDINGGNGTIIYFAPRQAIVVRQTDDVHGDLSDVLRGLRD
jgi:hypothetical protein